MSLDQYSTTPSNNDLTNYFKTGMRPSAVKNAGWDLMADLAQLFNSKTTSSGTNTLTLANPRPFGSLASGLWCVFWPGNANTGACTFAPDGLTAKNVFANAAALKGGEFNPAVPAIVVYDGTQWNLINPNRATGSFTGTPTGFSGSAGTCTVAYSVGTDGHSAQLQISAGISGTSNANTFTITGMPTALAPANAQGFVVFSQDNGTPGLGALILGAGSQVISLGKLDTYGALSGWTASGGKAFPVGVGCAISYQI